MHSVILIDIRAHVHFRSAGRDTSGSLQRGIAKIPERIPGKHNQTVEGIKNGNRSSQERTHGTQVTADAGEDVEKEERSSIVGGIADW